METSSKWFVLAVFLICYFLIIAKRKYYLLFAWAGVGILLSFGSILPREAISSINLNVLGIFAGTCFLSSLFIHSGVPTLLANKLIAKTKTVGWALMAMCLLSGFISSFAENVVTIMIIAPVAIEVARRLKVSPVSFLIGIAVSSNLQGCATMIGDSPSIIMAVATKMNFIDFFWMQGRPGIFFAVELGAVASFFVLYLIFRRYKQPTVKFEKQDVKSWVPTGLMIAMVLTLAISSLFKNRPYYAIAFICLGYGALGVFWHLIFHKEKVSFFKTFDWNTFLFLTAVFVLVGSLSAKGIIDMIAKGILDLAGSNAFLAYSAIVWISVVVSAFVDNIPYTMAMIPVAQLVASNLGMPWQPYVFGLLIGTCLGGNITPIAASANVVTMGMLRKEGHNTSFAEFARVGVPFTLAAVLIAYIFIWLVWA